jgi:hypothetical protein
VVQGPAGEGSPAQKLWRGQLDRLAAAQRDYRFHLLAVECLRLALDDGVVSKADQASVGSILERAQTPFFLMNKVKESQGALERLWDETIKLAGRMEATQKELGLPDSAM